MIPWKATSDSRIQVRPHFAVVPVAAPGMHIVGWEVRVWMTMRADVDCNLCGKTTGLRELRRDLARKRPDYLYLDGCIDNDRVRAPYAHECSLPVPWAANRHGAEGWEQPHHHPNFNAALDICYDERASPTLYSNAQLAYAAGLALLEIDEPERMHWNPAA
jgi:hypothetical protein